MPRLLPDVIAEAKSHPGLPPYAAEHPMRSSRSVSHFPALAVAALLCFLPPLQPQMLFAQGCAPSRFASPILGNTGDVYMGHGTWQVGVAYRNFMSNQFIVGHHVR